MKIRPWLALATLLACGSAAAEPTAADKAVAETLFQEGRKLLKQGDLDGACPKFAESHRLAPRLGTLLNLATCHEKQGRTASAWAEFREAAAIAKQDGRRDREKYARDHAAALEKRLSRVVFELERPLEAATLSLDGNEIGRAVWGTPLPVDPGEREVTARAPGHKAWSKTIQVEPGPSTITIAIPELEPEPDTSDAPPATSAEQDPREPAADGARDSGSTQKTLGWVALGAGVVGVGVGSYFGLQTFSKQNESEDHCDGTRCDATGVELRDDARTSGTISTIAFGVGALAIGGGIVLLLTAGDDEPKSAQRLWIAPGLGSLALGGTL